MLLKKQLTMKIKLSLTLIVILLVTSCQNDVSNVSIKGKIIDDKTELPIEGASVEIICWYYGNSPDQSYESSFQEETVTNVDGNFNFNFDYGAYVELKINSPSYTPKIEELYLSNPKNKILIRLSKN
jgi:hypothetical protein